MTARSAGVERLQFPNDRRVQVRGEVPPVVDHRVDRLAARFGSDCILLHGREHEIGGPARLDPLDFGDGPADVLVHDSDGVACVRAGEDCDVGVAQPRVARQAMGGWFLKRRVNRGFRSYIGSIGGLGVSTIRRCDDRRRLFRSRLTGVRGTSAAA